jgi:hypothetical protein
MQLRRATGPSVYRPRPMIFSPASGGPRRGPLSSIP